MNLRVAALLAALLPPAAGQTQTMDFACPAPGTTFTYDSGTKVIAKGRDGFDCLMQIEGGKPYRLRALDSSCPHSRAAPPSSGDPRCKKPSRR